MFKTPTLDPRAAQARGEELRALFQRYTTANLQGIGTDAFAQHIQSQLGKVDWESEGYSADELDKQRDLSIKFHWGHNHDFGAFQLNGKMGDRHLQLMANFLSLFPVTAEDFNAKRVLDIGCWTGGTGLLLAAMGARVHALEEVKKYADMANFLARSFGIADRMEVESRSIYHCNDESLRERFDMVYFPGVIYHLSDPLLALRILYNTLEVGGSILIESEGLDHPEPICRFEGSLVYRSGMKERLDRGGWNWFLPSPSALGRMMREAGFDEIETCHLKGTTRIYGYGRKVEKVGICKAGLSVPEIP